MKNKSIREFLKEFDERTIEINPNRPKMNLQKKLSKNEEKCKRIIEKELDDYFALLDIGISLIVEIHELSKEKQKENHEGFVFSAITAKLASMLFSIRKLLYSGLADSVKLIVRSFIEALDIFYICLENEEFGKSYGNTSKMYDNNEFWSKNISRGKSKKHIKDMFNRLETDEEYINYFFERKKSRIQFLSEGVHSSFNSAFTSFLMSTINGEFSDNIFGRVTTGYPNLLFSLLEDINLFNQIFYQYISEELGYYYKKCDLDKEHGKNYLHYHFIFDMTYINYGKQLDEFGMKIVDEINELKQHFVEKNNCI